MAHDGFRNACKNAQMASRRWPQDAPYTAQYGVQITANSLRGGQDASKRHSLRNPKEAKFIDFPLVFEDLLHFFVRPADGPDGPMGSQDRSQSTQEASTIAP
eukprot:7657783-Pyramimonas_sp.AAC.1